MFSKKPEAPQRPNTNSAKPMTSGTFSILGADVEITGDIIATAELHIDGKVLGDITCASLVQGDGSVISGAVKAETARLSGMVTGSITAKELIVQKTARINGDLNYESLTIEQGAQVQGQLNQQSGQGFAHGIQAEGEEPKLTLASSIG